MGASPSGLAAHQVTGPDPDDAAHVTRRGGRAGVYTKVRQGRQQCNVCTGREGDGLQVVVIYFVCKQGARLIKLARFLILFLVE